MTCHLSTTTPKKYLVLADSHAKLVSRLTTTSTYQILIESISSFKWIDDDQTHLSALHIFHKDPINSYLATTNAVMFLIGSNSLRKFTAPTVLNQIQYIINCLRHKNPHLAEKNSIGIVKTFPCFICSYAFPTFDALQHNINFYNNQLSFLATSLNFVVVDFDIQQHHLSNDQLHIHKHYVYIVSNNIFNCFDRLNSASEAVYQKVTCRSSDAQKRRNRNRHLRLAEKQAKFYICRNISPQWTLKNIKTYPQQEQIQFAKLAPIRNNQLRIRFNNSSALEVADSKLPEDFFLSKNFF